MVGYDEIRKTYFVQIKYRDPITLKQRSKKKRGFKTKREAKIYEAEAIQQSAQSGELTFEQVAHQWEDYALPSKEQVRRHHVAFERRFADLYKRPSKIGSQWFMRSKRKKWHHCVRKKRLSLLLNGLQHVW